MGAPGALCAAFMGLSAQSEKCSFVFFKRVRCEGACSCCWWEGNIATWTGCGRAGFFGHCSVLACCQFETAWE